MTAITVRHAGGEWVVTQGDRVVQRGFTSQAQAWKWVDRNEVHDLHLTREAADLSGRWALPATQEDTP